tara:strand:+ start:40 stop:168 length:129 start_codon:yes stop_codon:yes gene_type:complete
MKKLIYKKYQRLMQIIDEFSAGDLSSNNFHPSIIKIKKKATK